MIQHYQYKNTGKTEQRYKGHKIKLTLGISNNRHDLCVYNKSGKTSVDMGSHRQLPSISDSRRPRTEDGLKQRETLGSYRGCVVDSGDRRK